MKALKIAAVVSAAYVTVTGYVLYRLLMSHPYR